MKNILIVLLINILFQSCLKEKIVTPQAQLKSDTTSISEFLINNNITATKVAGGAWYKIDTVALGFYPVLADSVIISFDTYHIASSTESLSSLALIGSSSSIKVLLSSSIVGIQLTLPNFPVGSFGELYIPSGLAFGVSGNADPSANANYNIPPNANLLYKIKLLGVIGTHLTNDQTSITTYLTLIADSLSAKSITVITDPSSGLRYSVGGVTTSSTFPLLKDSVILSYSSKILNSSAFITADTTVKVALNTQIPGWKILMPHIPEGANATFYIPSAYGYGSAVSSKIPANSNLVYQIKLIKVIHNP